MSLFHPAILLFRCVRQVYHSGRGFARLPPRAKPHSLLGDGAVAPIATGDQMSRGASPADAQRAAPAVAAWAASRAAITSAAWPSGFTFGQVRTIWPSGSTRNVVRATPMYVLP